MAVSNQATPVELAAATLNAVNEHSSEFIDEARAALEALIQRGWRKE